MREFPPGIDWQQIETEHFVIVYDAVHRAIARRTIGMLQRVGVEPPVVFAGGAARNPCLVEVLSGMLGRPVHVPSEPQMVGALGAALLAAEQA